MFLRKLRERRLNAQRETIFPQLDAFLESHFVPEPMPVHIDLPSVEEKDDGKPTILFQIITERDREELDADLEEKQTASFSERVLELLNEKGLNAVSVYKKADLDRRLFSKLRSNPEYTPTMETAVLLCMAMELTYDESVDLLSRAGLAFSNHRKADLVAQFFIKKGIYHIPLYKEALYTYGLLKDESGE